MDTNQKLQESCKYINFIKYAEVLRVLYLETIRDKEVCAPACFSLVVGEERTYLPDTCPPH